MKIKDYLSLHLTDGEVDMPKYRIITSNISVYEHIVHADSEADALKVVDDGDSDMDWLDSHSQQVESIERIED